MVFNKFLCIIGGITKETRVLVEWDSIVGQLVSMDTSVLKEDWMDCEDFRYVFVMIRVHKTNWYSPIFT